MTRHLHAVQPPQGPWFLSSRAEIDEWARERWQTLSALLEAEGYGGEQEHLEFEERAA
jgi:hypothetical protein